MRKLQGNGCAEGMAAGRVLLKRAIQPSQLERPAGTPEEELRLLDESLDLLQAQLDTLYDKTLAESGEDAAELIESYQMIALDSALFGAVRAEIQDGRSAPSALRHVCEQQKAVFAAMDDPYMQERYTDIEAVLQELTGLCCGVQGALTSVELCEPTIVVADTLTPVDTVKLDKNYLRGFVTETGGATSHAVILARTPFLQSAAIRWSFCAPTISLAIKISCIPFSAMTSASPVFATAMPHAPAASCIFAISGHLWVLVWGRSAVPFSSA